MAQPQSRKPKVHISGSEALVWDVDDVRYLRQTLRITGSLAGSLPRSPMQNIFQGLPLRLMPEEVYALEAKGLVDIVDETHSYNPPPSSTEQSETHQQQSASGSEQITLSTRSDNLPWYQPQPLPHPAATSLQQCDRSVHDRQRDKMRATVFANLWDTQKYFVAPGMKFGGDYLLYKQDPLICHASFVASVKEMDESLTLTDLATSARLATTVQKKHLLCSPSPSGDTRVSDPQIPADSSPDPIPTSLSPDTANSIAVFAVEWAGF
ncbi:tRNA-splicing endonuclease subunit Sen34 [Entomortierella parvispora]|uniref:tRNA-splicing endonuclease subunit Sen34 n=1 Tax=Entomortierella parvispora TaxID=205924 RepID=A0A9P3LV19_9FUNG|nr:tRNA-splicing endonuclease subunit Sen34 [Entomortierella parvispora]